MQNEKAAAPTLSVAQASAMLVGVVVGIGIFKTPSIVAANSPDELTFLALWVVGGILTVIGALCYAELTSANPDSGGEYHFLHRAYGRAPAFLFAWGRMTVMQTGAIAAVAFVYGDYATVILPLGPWSSAIHAAIAVAALSLLQLMGTVLSGRAQLALTILTVSAVVLVAILGFTAEQRAPTASGDGSSGGAIGLALVFILLTYGGWNEAAYLSGEVRDARRNMARVLLIGAGAVTALYLIVNFSLVWALGLDGLRNAEAALAAVVERVFGASGAVVLALCVCATALSTLNATIFTGARTNHALGRTYRAFGTLGARDESAGAPVTALLVQGAIALALVAFGSQARDGFTAMVEYTAPVFWGFLLLIGISLFVFRMREPDREIPFRVPLYPVLPLIFIATCLYLLYSSLMYTGYGALVGVAVLMVGVPVYLLVRGSAADGGALERDGLVPPDTAPAAREV
jgi:APA family basic amino acid/polyamine antiporter